MDLTDQHYWVIFPGVAIANLLAVIFAYGLFYYSWHEKRGTEDIPGTGKYLAMMIVPMLVNVALGLSIIKGWGPEVLRSPLLVVLSAALSAHLFCFMFGAGLFGVVKNRRLGAQADEGNLMNFMLIAVPLLLFSSAIFIN